MMPEALSRPTAPPAPIAAMPRPGRLFFAVWGQAWLLTILGGGACGLVCGGFVSLVFFFIMIPVGMYGGVPLGFPLGLVLAVVVTRRATPPGDAAGLTRQLELVGIIIATLVTAFINLYFSVAVVISAADNYRVVGDIDYRVLSGIGYLVLGGVALFLNSVIAVAAAAIVGRESGHLLAARHLKRFDVPVPPRIELFRPIISRSHAGR
jgi:hypothetical protein